MVSRLKKAPVVDNGEQPVGEVAVATKAQPTAAEAIIIPRIEPKVLTVGIVGITPLVVCCWSEKAQRAILDKQMKKAKRGREAKDPEADYQASRYISTEGWDGVPACGLKGCLVNACRATDVAMTIGKRMIFVRAQGYSKTGQGLVRIYGTPECWQNPVKIDSGSSMDLRFRARFMKWSAKLEIEFLANMISAEQVLNLLELAGWCEGLCEWRPGAPKNNTGELGRFKIDRPDEELQPAVVLA